MERPNSQLIALTCYYKHKPGGLCKRLTRTMNALAERGLEVHYISASKFPLTHPNCHFHSFPWPGEKHDSIFFWMTFILLAPVYAFYLALKFRINRLFVFEATYAFLLQPVRMILNIPLVIFLRADSIENYRIKARPHHLIRIAQWVEKAGIHNTSVYAVSQHCLNNVLSRHKKSSLITTGVLRNDIPPIDKIFKPAKISLPINIACAGILETRKNQSFLIKLLSKLPEGAFMLHLYGVGPKQKELETLSKNIGVHQQVVFHSWQDIQIILQNTDLLLIPSLHEGAPNAALEAIAAEIPLLASDIQEHREILPEKAILPLEQELWLNRLTSIMQDSEQQFKEITNSLLATKKSLSFDWNQKITDLISGL